MTDQVTLREMCVLVSDALQRDDAIREAWTGPRSTEVGFKTVDGREVHMSVNVREVI